MILDGKGIAEAILDEVAAEVRTLKRKPGLAFLLIGDNPASQTYVAMKQRACARVGIHSRILTPLNLHSAITHLNQDPDIDGILLQLPLPSDPLPYLSAISPSKDVDGLHPLNAGKLFQGIAGGFVPCTPLGVLTLLERSQIPLSGQHVVVAGRSNLVGKPLAALLLQKQINATVTIVHSGTRNLKALTQSADILISAIGQPRFFTADFVRKGAVVVDVGIHREGKQLIGDVDFASVSKVASRITPVPGGVGPMTIAMLLQNTLQACKAAHP